MRKILLLLIAIAWTSSSCEKDDICDPDTATTPRLIIDFYSVTNPTIKKNVTNLALVAFGQEEDTLVFNAVDRIEVPLRATVDSTKYKFILNYNSADPSIINEDNLEFQYARTNIFVSRACGYKTLFVFGDNPYTLTDAATADGNWIKGISLLQPLILNEDDAHLKITF
jgi:hypothetical protein